MENGVYYRPWRNATGIEMKQSGKSNLEQHINKVALNHLCGEGEIEFQISVKLILLLIQCSLIMKGEPMKVLKDLCQETVFQT